MNSPNLAEPVGRLMRPMPHVFESASLARTADLVREYGVAAVIQEHTLVFVGVVTDAELLNSLDEENFGAAVGPFARLCETIAPYDTGASALRKFEEGPSFLPVVDDNRVLLGIVRPADFYPKTHYRTKPAVVGGMATPFGVYLTDGSLGGGTGGFALVCTGMLLCTMLLLPSIVFEVIARNVTDPTWQSILVSVAPVAVFVLLMQFLPISGIHAAEHMVVHAIERDEDLTVQRVRRMPRVHPRCGTNIAVAAMLLIGIQTGLPQIFKDFPPEGAIMVSLLATLFFFRPLGSMAQRFVTTRKPSDKQIQMGINAAKQLLDKIQTAPRRQRSIVSRIWASGLIHVVVGSTLMSFIIIGIATLLHLDVS